MKTLFKNTSLLLIALLTVTVSYAQDETTEEAPKVVKQERRLEADGNMEWILLAAQDYGLMVYDFARREPITFMLCCSLFLIVLLRWQV